MGNNNPFPHYQHPYPQPACYTFTEYLKQCSCNFKKNIENLFDTQFKGKIVQWQGVVTSLSSKEAKFLINPTDAEYSDSELTLLIDQTQSNNFVEKQESVFRGVLVSYGLLKNHVVRQVPFDDVRFPVDYALSYDAFLFYFGAKGQKAGDQYFILYWKNHNLPMDGTLEGFTNYDNWSSDDRSNIPPNTSAEFTFIPSEIQYACEVEKVRIRIPLKQKQFTKLLQKVSKTEKVQLTAKCVSRGSWHTMELVNAIVLPPAPQVIVVQQPVIVYVPQYMPSPVVGVPPAAPNSTPGSTPAGYAPFAGAGTGVGAMGMGYAMSGAGAGAGASYDPNQVSIPVE